MIEEKTARNQKVVEMMDSFEYTYQSAGDELGISKQRVEQIYRKNAPDPSNYSNHLKKMKELKGEEIVYVCKYCKTPVKAKDRPFKHSTRCKNCLDVAKVTNRRSKILKVCELCGKEFYPWKYLENTARFCSRSCNVKVINKARANK